MKMTFRWYGENSDSVTLTQIRQIPGMTGIMGFLDYKAAGEVWTKEEISRYVSLVQSHGLACEVIESVNVHVTSSSVFRPAISTSKPTKPPSETLPNTA